MVSEVWPVDFQSTSLKLPALAGSPFTSLKGTCGNFFSGASHGRGDIPVLFIITDRNVHAPIGFGFSWFPEVALRLLLSSDGGFGSKAVVFEGEAEGEVLDIGEEGDVFAWRFGTCGAAEDSGFVGLEFIIPLVGSATWAGEVSVPVGLVVGDRVGFIVVSAPFIENGQVVPGAELQGLEYAVPCHVLKSGDGLVI